MSVIPAQPGWFMLYTNGDDYQDVNPIIAWVIDFDNPCTKDGGIIGSDAPHTGWVVVEPYQIIFYDDFEPDKYSLWHESLQPELLKGFRVINGTPHALSNLAEILDDEAGVEG